MSADIKDRVLVVKCFHLYRILNDANWEITICYDTFRNSVKDRAIFHDRTVYVIGNLDDAELTVKSDENDGYQPCPSQVNHWMENTDTGYLGNRYIEVQCYYPRLLSASGLYDRLHKGEYLGLPINKLALVRFFNSETKTDDNDNWSDFMELFNDELQQYNGEISIHQVDCDRDPVPDCQHALPKIATFKKNETLTTMNPLVESLDVYIDRTIKAADPDRPPEECCDRIEIKSVAHSECNGIYSKTSKSVDGQVLYKQENVFKYNVIGNELIQPINLKIFYIMENILSGRWRLLIWEWNTKGKRKFCVL